MMTNSYIFLTPHRHAYPIYGLMCELDCDRKTITVTESLTF